VPRPATGMVCFPEIVSQLPRRLTPLQGLLGEDSEGRPLLLRLDAPAVTHALIAGTTGAGQTMLMRQFLLSLALFYRQGQVQLSLIDPKRRGLQPLANLPHLWRPLASTGTEIRRLLAEVVALTEKRYRQGNRWPKLVVAVNEVVEVARIGGPPAVAALTHLTRRGRETGVHLVASTQKPTSSLLGPLLKGNLPTRIVGLVADSKEAQVASGMADSGAEKLEHAGQFIAVVRNQITRFQSSWLTENTIRQTVSFLADRTSNWDARLQLSRGEQEISV